MLTAHFTHMEKPRGASDNQVSPPLAQDFNTIAELEKFLARNRAYIVKLSFIGSLDFNQDLEVN